MLLNMIVMDATSLFLSLKKRYKGKEVLFDFAMPEFLKSDYAQVVVTLPDFLEMMNKPFVMNVLRSNPVFDVIRRISQ